MPVKNNDNKKKNEVFSREKTFPPIWDDKYCDEFGELIEPIWCPWVTVDNRYTTILWNAFEDFEDVESISIASTIELIEEGAFWGCSVLKEIRVDENNKKYKSIDGDLYSKDGKTLIKYASGKGERIFIVPNKVKHINNYAFEDADHLTSISIGDNVVSIGEEAFSSCRNLINIRTSCDNQMYKSIDGILYSKAGTQLIRYPEGKKEISFMIPEFVTRISDYAFAGGWYLNDIFIDKNISFISENAFYSCYGLTSINVIVGNREYKSIDGVLYSKDGKKLIRYPQGKTRNSFIIPNDVICIADNAFGFCKNLTNIIINKEVSSIGMKAFWFCDNLRTIYYMGTETDWAKISIAPFSNVIDRDIYYYSETEPALNVDGTAYKGNYWRYVDGAIVVWKYIKE